MNLPELSIKRPIFITCVFIITLVVGALAMSKLPVDLFPNVTFPVVTVTTVYPGAGPKEVETLVTKPIEDELSTLSGIKRLSSFSRDSVSVVVAEFNLDVDVKDGEQQVRDRVSSLVSKLPDDSQRSVIRRIDPADQPMLVLSFKADLSPADLYDVADQDIRPRLENVTQVGLVEILGGRKREIHVELDAKKLKEHEISASQLNQKIAATGKDIPAGKVDQTKQEAVIRTVGQFASLKEIERVGVNFLGNDVPVSVSDVGVVTDSLVDEKTRTYVNGEKSLLLTVYRQSGANTVKVAEALKKRVAQLNDQMKSKKGAPKLEVVQDMSKPIADNVYDVEETIGFGIVLLVIVVLFFLGSFRSTMITALALPNSILGAFILMSAAGFSVNIMTLLALSLAVGLLIDDAIVVRENIFRHIEMGKSPKEASLEGTREVTLAVVATTATVIAVFGPIGFLQGVVGQFFKEFGLTVCFAMAISLLDALTMAPMLSAYFAGTGHAGEGKGTVAKIFKVFDNIQSKLEDAYERSLGSSQRHPILVLVVALLIFFGSMVAVKHVSKTFLPPQDTGEFSLDIDLPPGTTLNAMDELARKVEATMRENKEVRYVVARVGTTGGEVYKASMYVKLVPAKERSMNTTKFKDMARKQLKIYSFANPAVKDVDNVGGGQRPFNLDIQGNDIAQLEEFAGKVFEKLKDSKNLKDPDVSFRSGAPEVQIVLDKEKTRDLGMSSAMVGAEMRTLVEGMVPAVYREEGREYDIRVRLKEDQRDVTKNLNLFYVPNMNYSLVRLKDVGAVVETKSPATIERQNRRRYVRIMADVAPEGKGMSAAMDEVHAAVKEVGLPEGMAYGFSGQAENFGELIQNMIIAAALGIIFIYLVLASLYESFVTPFTIMLVLPLAICGAFYALLIANASLNIFSMIGCIMLLGVATKNSILMVDYIKQLQDSGVAMKEAIIKGSRTRLRPILMTSGALIAGMMPLALGLNEASRQRTSMGITVIGGLISSTLLTLYVVPAAYGYIERFRVWSGGLMTRIFVSKAKHS